MRVQVHSRLESEVLCGRLWHTQCQGSTIVPLEALPVAFTSAMGYVGRHGGAAV